MSYVIVNLMHDYVLVLKKLSVPRKSTHRAIECVRDLASSLTRLFKVNVIIQIQIDHERAGFPF